MQYINLMTIENYFPIHMPLVHWGYFHFVNLLRFLFIPWHLRNAFFLSVSSLQAKYYLVFSVEKNCNSSVDRCKQNPFTFFFTFFKTGQKEMLDLCKCPNYLQYFCFIQLLSVVLQSQMLRSDWNIILYMTDITGKLLFMHHASCTDWGQYLWNRMFAPPPFRYNQSSSSQAPLDGKRTM